MTLDVDVKRWAESKGFTYLANSKNPRLIIFGEEHFRDELIGAQVELIKALQPEYVLHEFQGDKPYDPKSFYTNLIVKNGEESEIMNSEIQLFRRLSRFLGFQLIGADLSATRALSISFQHPDEVHSFREFEGMSRTMIEYAGKSSKPVIAIVGAYHSHPASDIHPILEENGVKYCVVQQVETERLSKVDRFEQKQYL